MFLRSFILIFLGLFITNYPGFSQEIQTKPTAIFSAVFWDRFTSKSITYAPWGNFDEQNATKITLQVGFSTPSQPVAYYGKSPIRFFETTFLEDEEGSYSEKVEEMCEFSFEQDSGTTKELFLIFLKFLFESLLEKLLAGIIAIFFNLIFFFCFDYLV